MAKTWMTEYGLMTDGWETPMAADYRRHYEMAEGTHASRMLQSLRAPGLQAMAVVRFGQWCLQQPRLLRVLVDPLYAVADFLIKVLWGIDISRYAQIGPGLYIGHFGGITVSPLAVIGRHCNLSQSTTIGVAGHGEREGAPNIGDEVYIAPGARVFGRIRIGNNVKIGANAVIHKDIPDNAVVALDPGFKILNFRGNHPSTQTGEEEAL